MLEASKHPKADKLLVLKVDVGEARPRQILAGIAHKFAPDALIGRTVVVVCNLKPRKMRGLWSNGMLLAASEEDVVDLLGADCAPGARIS